MGHSDLGLDLPGSMNLDISTPEFKAGAYPFYARLRRETPAFALTLPDKRQAWLVTRYDDVMAVLKDERFVKDRQNAMTPELAALQRRMPRAFKPLERNMLSVDPPDHTRLRALVHKAFTPRLVEQMRERIQTLADGLLDAMQRRRRMDIIRDYALPLPTMVIADMLGVPAADRHRFHRWSSGILAADRSRWGVLKMLPNVILFLRYIRKLVRARRNDPRDDLVSALVKVEEAGVQLTEDELLAMVFLLLLAGHETTVNLIGNGVLALFEQPEQLQRLRSEPALIHTAVEELLRYSGPLETATERYAREDVTIGGATIPRGDTVLAGLASANRDERQFCNPDTLDLARDPNKHVAFGFGIHYCLGAPLARLEGRIAINTILARFPDLGLSVPASALRWRKGHLVRGLEALPVTGTLARKGPPCD